METVNVTPDPKMSNIHHLTEVSKPAKDRNIKRKGEQLTTSPTEEDMTPRRDNTPTEPNSNAKQEEMNYPMVNSCTEEELEDLQPEQIKNKFKPIASECFNKYYDSIGEANFQHRASLSVMKMSNLMFKKRRLLQWIIDSGFKTAEQQENDNANKKRNRGKQFGIGNNATDYETTLHLQLIRYTNVEANQLTGREILIKFATILFELTNDINHTLQIVTPVHEIDAHPIFHIQDVPEDCSEYTMNGQHRESRDN